MVRRRHWKESEIKYIIKWYTSMHCISFVFLTCDFNQNVECNNEYYSPHYTAVEGSQ